MDFKTAVRQAVAVFALGTFALAPVTADAQSSAKRRQEQKNTWRNLAIGSGVVGLLGLLKGDSTLTFAGGAGALYSAWRYEEDRKGQSRQQRARYELFRRGSFTRNGQRYVRKTVWKNGKKYYQFVKAR